MAKEASQVRWAPRETPAFLVCPDCLARKVKGVTLERLETRASRATMVPRVTKVRTVFRDSREKWEHGGFWVPGDFRDFLDHRGYQVLKDQLDRRETRVPPVKLDSPGNKVYRDQSVRLDRKGYRDH